MSRALVHIGMSLALVLAPTLCCCKIGWLSPTTGRTHARTSAPPQTEPSESCCHRAKSCCDTSTHSHLPPTPETPGPVHTPECVCCLERPDAAPPEGTVSESSPQPTGELLAPSNMLGAPAHTAPRRLTVAFGVGVDARYAALFERHVLRC